MNRRFYFLSSGLLVLMFFLSSLAEASSYKWQDENGKWHFTNDFNKVPEDIRKKMGADLSAHYSKYEDADHIYQYKGFNKIKIAHNVFLKHDDFFIVKGYVQHRKLALEREYPTRSYPILFLHKDNKIYEHDLHVAYFLTGYCLPLSEQQDLLNEYNDWKSGQKDISRGEYYRDNKKSNGSWREHFIDQ